MKKHYKLSTLIALVAALTLSQAMADGMTYDPYDNYYNSYYGLDTLTVEKASQKVKKAEVASVSIESLTDFDMADPRNFYNW